MENRHVLKRKLFAVVKAGIFGAILFNATILLDNLTYSMSQHGYISKTWNDFFSQFTFPSAILSVFITNSMGLKHEFVNEYVAYGLTGSATFALIAAFWQFVVKGKDEEL